MHFLSCTPLNLDFFGHPDLWPKSVVGRAPTQISRQ